MDPRRAFALLFLVPLLLLAGCGGNDDDSGTDDTAARSSDSAQETGSDGADDEQPAADSSEAHAASSASFALTPELTKCMEAAGFTQDAPPTGGLAAWRHPSGGRVVVGSGSDVTLGIADEIGTSDRPANVEGNVVIAANEADAEAASACLD
jgi:hypothetical protein